MTQLELALAVAGAGWPVFPARLTPEGAKRPHLRGWQVEATTLAPVLRAWWERWPDALVAVPTGAESGLYVLDVDSDDARPVARALLPPGCRPPVLPTHRERGIHLLFHGGGPCRTVNGKLHPKLDVKGEGGYVVAWNPLPRPEDLPSLPSEVVRAASRRSWRGDPVAGRPPTGPVPLAAACVGVRLAREGERNQTLNRWAWATSPQVLAGLLDEAVWRRELVAAAAETGYPVEEAEEVLRCVLEARRSR